MKEVCKTFNCGGGISLGGIPQGQGIFFKLNALEKEIIKNKAKRIIHISGNIKGYIYKNQIINLNDLTSGYIKENSVYNLLDEYIGKLITSNIKNSYTIEIENDEYEDREPIYIEEKNKIINKLLNNPVIDTSYRILG